MAKPSGVKITYAISQLAEWFGKEINRRVAVGYVTNGKDGEWGVEIGHGEMELHKSFSTMRRWMEGEVRRRKILFREFSL